MNLHEEIKSRLDLVQFLEENGVEVKRNRCLCIHPDHNDNTPSMSIKDERFKCFSCGEGGDIFNAAEHLNRFTPGEAFRHLADRAGVSLKGMVRTVRPNVSREADTRAILLAMIDPEKAFDMQAPQEVFFCRGAFYAFLGIIATGSLNTLLIRDFCLESGIFKGKNFPTEKANEAIHRALHKITPEQIELIELKEIYDTIKEVMKIRSGVAV